MGCKVEVQGCGKWVGRKFQNLDLPEDEPSLGKMAKQASHGWCLCHFLSISFPNARRCLSLPLGGALDFVAFTVDAWAQGNSLPFSQTQISPASFPQGLTPNQLPRLQSSLGVMGLIVNHSASSKGVLSVCNVLSCRAPYVTCLHNDS